MEIEGREIMGQIEDRGTSRKEIGGTKNIDVRRVI